MSRASLERRILAALKQAVAEGQPEVADHLLRALETLYPDAVLCAPPAEAHAPAARGKGPE